MFSRLVCITSIAVLGAIAPSLPVFSQSIVPANDGIGTTVTPHGDRLDIEGGSLSEDRSNLFHSFEQFNLESDRTANFLSNPEIQNILSRVTGGEASYINGLIQVVGGDSNLYFMNPAGILFGQEARLNVPADFIATTATGIGFENGWFEAFQTSNISSLMGDPATFSFLLSQPGAIVNEGVLAVLPGRNLGLLGGATANTGSLSSPGGTVMVTAVSGRELLRLSVPGNLLSLEIAPTSIPTVGFDPLSLPELLTGGGVDRASRLTVNPDGTVSLAGSAVRVNPEPGTAIVSGAIDVSDNRGSGEIGVFGDRVAAMEARLDASGTENGGRIFFGGNLRGEGSLPTAQFAFVDPLSSFFADGLGNDGGEIVVWSDDTTLFSGTATARGLQNGGFVEISGRDRLAFRGRVDVGGSNPGTVLFDPDSITIDRVSRNNDPNDPNFQDPNDPPPDPDFQDPNDPNFQDPNDPPPDPDFQDPNDPPPDPDFQDPNDPNFQDPNDPAFRDPNDPPPDPDFQDPNDPNFRDPNDPDFRDPNDPFLDPNDPAFRDPNDPNFQDPNDPDFRDPNDPAFRDPNDPNFQDPNDPDFRDPNDPFLDPNDPDFRDPNDPFLDPNDPFLDPNDPDFRDPNDPFLDPNDPDFRDPNDPLLDPNDPAFRDPNDPLLDPNDPNTPTPDPNFNDFVDGIDNNPLDLDITMTPTDLANTNGIIVLDATNDITISTPIANPNGIEIYAGRSININANLNTSMGNGDVVAIANDPGAASGLRQPGPASIAQAPGTEIVARGGNVFLRLENAGEIGEIRLGRITTNGTVEIDANGGNIVRSSDPNAQVTANVGVFLTTGRGGIGNPNAPIRVSINDLQVRTGSGGQFFNIVGGQRQTIEDNISRDIEADVRVDDVGEKPDAPDRESQGEFEGFDEPDGEVEGFDDDRREGPGESDEFGDRGDEDAGFDEGGEEDDGDRDRGEIEDEEFDVDFTEGAEIAYTDEVEAVASLEQDRLQEFSTYLGNLANSSISIQSAREALTEVSRQTGTQSAVVYVTLLPTQLELVVFTAGDRPIRRSVAVSRSEVLEVATQFRGQLTNPRYRRTTEYLEPAQKLYQWAIAPILPELKAAEIDTLLFSMPTGLRSLPIAALHDGEQFLVEQFGLSLIPSLGLVDTRYRTLQNTSVLAMGVSEFGESLDPLPAVPLELTTITEEWWSGSAFLNEQFTRENLVQQRRRHGYEIVHLATHGEFLTFEDSYIQLWDERLHLNQLRRLGWNEPAVELVVLSACRTAVGSEEAELGFAGFAVSAGVKSALASLWYVSDEGTLGLMSQFYRQLRETRTKSEALRQAQLALLNGDVRVESGSVRIRGVAESLTLPEELRERSNFTLSHPYYWAGFTMVGSPW